MTAPRIGNQRNYIQFLHTPLQVTLWFCPSSAGVMKLRIWHNTETNMQKSYDTNFYFSCRIMQRQQSIPMNALSHFTALLHELAEYQPLLWRLTSTCMNIYYLCHMTNVFSFVFSYKYSAGSIVKGRMWNDTLSIFGPARDLEEMRQRRI